MAGESKAKVLAYQTPISVEPWSTRRRSPLAVASMVVTCLGVVFQFLLRIALPGIVWAPDFSVSSHLLMPAMVPVILAILLALGSLMRRSERNSTAVFALVGAFLAVVWWGLFFGGIGPR